MVSIDLQAVQLSGWVQMVMARALDILFGNWDREGDWPFGLRIAQKVFLTQKSWNMSPYQANLLSLIIWKFESLKLNLLMKVIYSLLYIFGKESLDVITWVSLNADISFIPKKNKHKNPFSCSRKRNSGNWVWVPLILTLQCDGWVSGFTLAWFMNLANCNVVTQVVDGSNVSHYGTILRCTMFM